MSQIYLLQALCLAVTGLWIIGEMRRTYTKGEDE